MNNGMDEFFKQQKRLQKLMSSVYSPAVQNIATQMNAISQLQRGPMVTAFQGIDRSVFDPIVKIANTQNSVVKQMRSMFEWQSEISQLMESRAIKLTNLIPDSLYDSLNELTSEIDAVQNYQAGTSEIPAEITVRSQTDDAVSKNNMTWEAFIMMMIMIFQMFMQFQDGIAEQERHEERMSKDLIHHEERMIEERKQTELHERSIELQEQAVPTQISEEQYQIINEKLDLLIQESLDSVTENPADQDASEND